MDALFVTSQAVIDAIAQKVVIVDGNGTVIAVNAPWSRSCVESGANDANCGLGMNYFDVCEHQEKPTSAELVSGISVARGLRKVLAGEVDRFYLTYPCHVHAEKRWFSVRATPITLADGSQGALILHHDRVSGFGEREQSIEAALIATVEAIGEISLARDPYTARHQLGVAQLAGMLADHLGLDEDAKLGLYLGSTMHDVGKISIPSEILVRPGELSAAEYQLVQTHVSVGANLISSGSSTDSSHRNAANVVKTQMKRS